MSAASEDFDVVVAGGGPAGLSAARAAAASGARTLVAERGREIGGPVRTSGASWIAELTRLGVEPWLFHPTTRVKMTSPGREVRFEYEPPINCVLDVRGLYQHLAVEAARAGARVCVNTRVAPRADGSLELAAPDGTRVLWPRVAVDATGSAAVLARARGLVGAPRRSGVGAELELYAPLWDERELWLAVGSTVAPSGYGWVFPAPGGRVRAGVGMLAPDSGLDPAPYLRRLVRAVPALAAGAELEYHRGIIPSEGPLVCTIAERLIVVGDAAGHVLPTAGEGIRFALELGDLAGRIAAEAASSGAEGGAGAGSAEALSRFESEWSVRYRGLFELGDRLNRRLAHWDDRQWDSALGWMERAGPAIAARLMRGDIFQGTLTCRVIDALLPAVGWLF